ncbi:MAG: fluoride exporter, partial [Frankiaceae bacterium]|nr:fluoride exporter [Frankiaceae bacterium]
MTRTDAHPELPQDPDTDSARRTTVGAIALVAVGGALGTWVRYAIGVSVHDARAWPISTLAVNVAGAFVLGLLVESLVRRGPDTGWRRNARLAAGTGFCGGLTTYSSLAVETDELARRGLGSTAIAYAVVTVVIGLLA